MNKSDKDLDAKSFAELLRKTKIPNQINIGKFILQGKKGVIDRIQYNQDGFELLKNEHEYTFPILNGDLQISLQLYENDRGHYRLFCYTKINGKQGMAFSVNLTTEKESNNVIFLAQKIKFVEQYMGNKILAKSRRRQKQVVFCNLLRNLGFDLTENNDLILGIFDPIKRQLINTTPEKLLNDFIVVSILKGHFQGNKGYQLEILPTFDKLDNDFDSNDDEIKNLPSKVANNKTKRSIPLAWRYTVLKRDNFKCFACGHSPSDNGVKLNIDHKIPFSLGGKTELKNLQTLCNECNLSKSNKHID